MMASSRLARPAAQCLKTLRPPRRFYSDNVVTNSSTAEEAPKASPYSPRHLLSISDLSADELVAMVRFAARNKEFRNSKKNHAQLYSKLTAKTIALMFTKRSTRTRVSSEAAINMLGGHPMFLGAQDIQLGVNESLYDSSVVISSMTSGIVARVNAHDDVVNLAKHSSVPVINALSDLYHPLQTLADFQTIHEAFPSTAKDFTGHEEKKSLGLQGLKIAWIGDANNVLFDLAIGAAKLGVELSVATPKGYEIPAFMREIITSQSPDFRLTETNVPEEAIKNADVLVTDTWVSMGQEEEAAKKIKDFEGFQITKELALRGGAKEGWRFMHCLPRHKEEVSDEVFYSPASLVFKEAENRLWAAVTAFSLFFHHGGQIPPPPSKRVEGHEGSRSYELGARTYSSGRDSADSGYQKRDTLGKRYEAGKQRQQRW